MAIFRILVLMLLAVYLVVPFKSQFLDTLHTISHISLVQDPHHHHNHNFNNHNHHHGLLERISISLDDEQAKHQLPENLSEYKFQMMFPSDCLKLLNIYPLFISNLFKLLATPVLIGTYFEVPTPPP